MTWRDQTDSCSRDLYAACCFMFEGSLKICFIKNALRQLVVRVYAEELIPLSEWRSWVDLTVLYTGPTGKQGDDTENEAVLMTDRYICTVWLTYLWSLDTAVFTFWSCLLQISGFLRHAYCHKLTVPGVCALPAVSILTFVLPFIV